MTASRRHLLAASGAALALAAAGCGSSEEGAAGAGSSQGLTVTTTEFSWVAATLTDEIVAQVAQVAEDDPDLGVAGLETTQLDPAAAWAGAQNGDVDLVTEVALPDQQPFLDEATGTMDLLGEVCTGANQGWFVPTSATQPGRPLEGLTSVTQLPEHAEALLAQLDRADTRAEPVLVHLYQPHWVLAQHEMTQLEEPDEHVDGCFEEGGDGSCAMLDYAAGIAASAELQEQVPASTDMLGRMEVPVSDMDAMIAQVDVEERDAAEVAQEWVEADADAVETWVG